MEKISIKPRAREIVYKNNEPGLFYDAFSYDSNGGPEKALGSLYIVGQVKYGDEDLAYLVSLISSLARREYYANAPAPDQTQKTAFESTLKKLNEVLSDFFKNKQFKMTVGLAAIAGDNILISRIGNVRFSLARNNEHIDVVNNVSLFNQEHNNEKEFSNVISGKVLVGDKLFMYLPTRTIIAREKPLREILKKEDQAIFAEKIEGLSKNSPKFTCCGIHVEIGHLKEIPIESKPAYFASSRNKKQSEIPEKEGLTVGTHLSAKEKRSVNDSIENDKPVTEYNPSDDRPHIISADVSLGKRKNFITLLSGIFRKGYGRSNRKVFMRKSSGKYNKTIIGSIIGLALLVGLYSVIVVFRSTDESVKQAQENLKSAQDQISQNDYRSARSLLQSAIGSIIANDAKSAKKVRQEATILLGSIDKTSDKQPSLVAENTTLTGLLKLTLTAESKIYAINADGSVFDVSSNDYKKIGDTAAKASSYLFDDVKLLAVSSDTLAILNKTSGKTDSYKIAGFDTVKDAAIYEGNIYALNTDSILKYNDIATTEAKPANWSKDIPAIAQSLTVDGNLYVLSNDGRISIYFKGAKQSEYDLNVTPSTDARIFTSKDLPFIYLLDKTGKKVMVFDKTNGNLQTSYSLSTVGSVSDISIGSDQAIYILSSDNKIWQIR